MLNDAWARGNRPAGRRVHRSFTPTFGRGPRPTVHSRRVSVVGRDPRFIRAAFRSWVGTHGSFASSFSRGSGPTVHSRRVSVVGRDPRFIRVKFQSWIGTHGSFAPRFG